MSNRGFTFFEVVIAISMTALMYVTVSSVFRSNTNMVEDSLAMQRAEAVHRRNMASLSRVLRGIDMQTLAGMNDEGIATAPAFGRVTGADSDELTYMGNEQLRWLPAPVGVNGISSPGAVYLLRDGQRELVADRVPSGGFHVRQQGQNLVIHLSTYWSTNTSHVVTRTSESVVSVRN